MAKATSSAVPTSPTFPPVIPVGAAPCDDEVVVTEPSEATTTVGLRVTTEFPGFVAVTVTFAARDEAEAWLYAAFVKPQADETEVRSFVLLAL